MNNMLSESIVWDIVLIILKDLNGQKLSVSNTFDRKTLWAIWELGYGCIISVRWPRDSRNLENSLKVY